MSNQIEKANTETKREWAKPAVRQMANIEDVNAGVTNVSPAEGATYSPS